MVLKHHTQKVNIGGVNVESVFLFFFLLQTNTIEVESSRKFIFMVKSQGLTFTPFFFYHNSGGFYNNLSLSSLKRWDGDI